MGLVETVACELVDQVEQRVGLALVDTGYSLAAINETFALRIHFGLDLLTHCAAQKVGVAQGVSCKDLRGLHNLFLVNEDPVGFGQNAFQLGMRIFDFHLTGLALAEQRNVIHRARTIKRNKRDDVAEIGRLHRCQRTAHAFRFKLENPHRIAALHELVDLCVIERQKRKIDLDVAPFEQIGGLLENRQRLEAEKVEFDEAGAFDIFHVVLRNRHVRPRVAIKRHQLGKRSITDHHACGVGRTVTRKALELHGEIDEALHLIVVVVFPFEIGGPVQRPWQRPRVGRMVGHHLAEAIHVPIAHLQDAAGIAQNGARFQFTERDDLSDVIVSVFLLDIADHFAPPRFAEVDIEVGHRDTFGVEKTFKEQTELDRIEIRDGQSPRDQATRTRTTSRAYRNIVVLGPFYEVGNDQEVARKAHLIDDIDFELQAIEINLSLVVGHLAIRFETRF